MADLPGEKARCMNREDRFAGEREYRANGMAVASVGRVGRGAEIARVREELWVVLTDAPGRGSWLIKFAMDVADPGGSLAVYAVEKSPRSGE